MPDTDNLDSPSSAAGDLVDRLRRGEPAAFEEFVRTFGGRMRAAAMRLLMDDAEADDAVQDAFLSAFRSLDRFARRAELGTWLHRILINAALTKLRKKGRRDEAGLVGLLPEFHESGVFQSAVPGWAEPADAPAIRRELHERIHTNILQLPDNHRVPLLLRDIEGLSNEEISTALDLTTSAVRVRVHRARQALRTLLEPHFGGLE